MTKLQPTSRRTIVSGIAAGAVGGPLLAACGNNDSKAGDSGGSNSSGGSGGNSAGNAIAAKDIPDGGGKIFEADKIVVTQPEAGTYKAFSSICPHKKCSVSKIENKEIVCMCHGSRFSIEDGSVKQGPAEEPLPAKKVTKKGNNLEVS